MFNLLKKIVKTGCVTEAYYGESVPPRFRGEVSWKEGQCQSCQRCRDACPTGAIHFRDGKLNVENSSCTFCGQCVAVCEHTALIHTGEYQMAEMKNQLSGKIRSMFQRSLHIRHVDAGSCNGCDWEMAALNNPIYDLQQYGIDFVASPRHADMLMITGVVTRNLSQALIMTYEATPSPKLVMAVGACAAGGNVYGNSYAIRGAANTIVPVDIFVPGCPPRPAAIIYGLLLALDRLEERRK